MSISARMPVTLAAGRISGTTPARTSFTRCCRSGGPGSSGARSSSPRVSTSPGIDDADDQAARLEVEGKIAREQVQRRLAGPVGVEVGWRLQQADGPGRAAQEDDLPLAARLDERQQPLGQQGGPEGVRPERVQERGLLPGAEQLRTARPQQRGVVQQDVQGEVAAQARGERVDGGRAGEVQCLDPDAGLGAGEPLEIRGGRRVAAGGDDPPPGVGVLPHELEADAAIGARDENGRHVLSLNVRHVEVGTACPHIVEVTVSADA